MTTMAAAVLKDVGILAIENRPEPSLAAATDVIVRVQACGVCGTDLHILSDPPGYPAQKGVILGHEIVGEIAAVGAAVTAFEVGDRVAVRPILTCGTCTACMAGNPNHCPNRRDLGVWQDGGLAEKLVVPASACIKVSKEIPLHIAALTEPLACVVNAVHRVKPAAGERAIVLGAGAIGLLFTAVLKVSGVATVAVVEVSAARAEAALAVGADAVINPQAESLQDAVTRLMDAGPDIVIDAVGSQLGTAVGIACRRGRVLLFGLNEHARPEVPQAQITLKELDVLGSFVGQHAFPDAVRLLESGLLDLSPIVSHQVELENLVDLLPQLRTGKVIKAVVTIGS
jgi:threonine dehydrogenase-like Zn-dependent dehydrogenase